MNRKFRRKTGSGWGQRRRKRTIRRNRKRERETFRLMFDPPSVLHCLLTHN